MEALSPYQRKRLASVVGVGPTQPCDQFVHPSIVHSPRFEIGGPQDVTRITPPPPAPTISRLGESKSLGSSVDISIEMPAAMPLPPMERATPSPSLRTSPAALTTPPPRATPPPSRATPLELKPLDELIVLPKRVRRVAGGYVEVPHTAEELLEYATTAVGWLRADMSRHLRHLSELPTSQSAVGVLASLLSELRASTHTLSEEVSFLERALVAADGRGRRCEDAMLIERALHQASRRAAAEEVQRLVDEFAAAARRADERLAAASAAHEAERAAADARHEAAAAEAATAAAAELAARDASARDHHRRSAARVRRLETELAAERRLREAEGAAAARALDELRTGQQAHSKTLQATVDEAVGVFRSNARAQAQQAAQFAQAIKAAVEQLRVRQSELRHAHAIELGHFPAAAAADAAVEVEVEHL